MKRLFAVVAVGVWLVQAGLARQAYAGITPERLTQIQEEIRAHGLQWIAGENGITRLDDSTLLARLMHGTAPGPKVSRPRIESQSEVMLPTASSFSWGNNLGYNWMTPVRNQGSCQACWAFGLAGMTEPNLRIALNKPSLPVDLSEQHLISCSATRCTGSAITIEIDTVEKYGCPPESCFVYHSENGTPPLCGQNRCSDWRSFAYRLHSSGYLWRGTVAAIKHQIQYHGPVAAFMFVYEDFFAYNGGSGPYVYTSGPLMGEHSVVLYGWNDADSCWLAKNSWGTDWGETGPDGTGGWFRIRMWSDAAALTEPTQIQRQIDWVDCPGSENFSVSLTADSTDMYFVQQADLDGDKIADFVYTGQNSDSLHIIYGNQDGSIAHQVGLFRIGRAALQLGYLNLDSTYDIVAYTGTRLYSLLRSATQSRVYTLDSTLVAVEDVPGIQSGSVYPSIAVGYFDADEFLDVAASPDHIFFGNGNGQFPTSITVPFTFDEVGSGDYNRDGHDDLLCVAGDSVVIYVNDGQANMTRTSAVKVGYRSFDAPKVIADIDWNRDGFSDWAVVTSRSGAVPDTSVITVGFGDGTGGVLSFDTLTLNGRVPAIVSCNINADTYLDAAVISDALRSLVTLQNDGFGHLIPSDTIPLVNYVQPYYALATADLDRDGNADFLSGGEVRAPVQLLTSQQPDRPVLSLSTQPLVVSAYNNVSVRMVDPSKLEVSRIVRTVAGSEFRRGDFDANSHVDQRLINNNLVLGEYNLILNPYPGDEPTGPFTMDIRIDGARRARIFKNYTGGFSGYGGPGATTNRTADSMVFYYEYQTSSPIMPPNGLPYYMNPPTFRWNGLVPPPTSETRYHFQLDRYFDLRAPICDDSTLAAAVFTPAFSFGLDSIYYWHVRVFDGTTWGPYSRTFAAYMGPPCCIGETGNVNGEGIVDLADLSLLIAYLVLPAGTVAICPPEANINATGIIDLSDLSMLIAYLTRAPGTVQLPACK